MFFNFKNKNLIIILLLSLVLASVFCYSLMIKDTEGMNNMSDSFSNTFQIYQIETYIQLVLHHFNQAPLILSLMVV